MLHADSYIPQQTNSKIHEPWLRAVIEEQFKLVDRDEFTSVDSRLNGAESPKYSYLVDAADDGRDVKPS